MWHLWDPNNNVYSPIFLTELCRNGQTSRPKAQGDDMSVSMAENRSKNALWTTILYL